MELENEMHLNVGNYFKFFLISKDPTMGFVEFSSRIQYWSPRWVGWAPQFQFQQIIVAI